MKILAIVFFTLISACTYQAEVSEEDINNHVTCTDTRDGEVFSFHAKNMSNIRVGMDGYASMDIIDDKGNKRSVNNGMEIYLKCVQIEETL